MKHLYKQFEQQQQWWNYNTVVAQSNEIIDSALIHCGIPMQQYVGKQFVDWTHRCSKCGVMYGCA